MSMKPFIFSEAPVSSIIKTALGKIHDFSSVYFNDLLDTRAIILVGVHLQEQQLSVYALLRIQGEDLFHDFQLGCLRQNLMEALSRSAEYYSYPREGRIIGSRNRQGVDVETASSEKAD